MAATPVFGGATADIFAYTAHFVGSSGTDTWANATTASTPCSWATMLTNLAVGEVALIMDDGTYTLTASSSLTNAGSGAGYVVIAGTGNQNGADSNGGRPLIDYDSPGAGITMSSKIVWLENLEVIGSTGIGVTVANKDVVYDVLARNNGSSGFSLGTTACALFCEAHSNTTDGFSTQRCRCYGCVSHDNTVHGFDVGSSGAMLSNCIAYDNTQNGFDVNDHAPLLVNITSEANSGDGVNAVGTISGCGTVNALCTNNAGQGLDIATPKLWFDVFGHADGNTTADDANILQADRTSGTVDYVVATDGSEDLRLDTSSTADELALGMPVATNPTLDKGALQNAEPAGGGGGVKMAGDSGGMVG